MKVWVENQEKELRIMDRRNPDIEWTEAFIENADYPHDEEGQTILTLDEYEYWQGEIDLQYETDKIINELEDLGVDWSIDSDFLETNWNDRDETRAVLKKMLRQAKKDIALDLLESPNDAQLETLVDCYENLGWEGAAIKRDIHNDYLSIWQDGCVWYLDSANHEFHIDLDGKLYDGPPKSFEDIEDEQGAGRVNRVNEEEEDLER